MSDLSIVHILKISGVIAQHRALEFESTVKYTCRIMPEECLEKTLSSDIFEKGVYYFFARWSTEAALKKFIDSEEYQLVRSAYDALGVLEKIEIGYHVALKTIRINH